MTTTDPRGRAGTRPQPRRRAPAGHPRKRNAPARNGRWQANVALLTVAAAFALPLVWLVLSSVDGGADLRVRLPTDPTLDNYSAVLTDEITFTPMLNSLLLCGSATAVTVCCAALAAYPLSRYRARFSRPYLLTILFATSLPITAIMVPVYGLFVQVELIDTVWGTSLFLATAQLPIAVWLMKNFMDGVPRSLEEAAWTDGASAMQALGRIVLPLMAPGVMVVTVFSFVAMWGNFFVPFMLLLSPDRMPASVSIFTFFGNTGQVAYGQLAAFSVVYSTPAVLLYVLIARRLGSGFALGGAVKG